MHPDYRFANSDYALDHDCPTMREIINADPQVKRERYERLAKATGLPVSWFEGVPLDSSVHWEPDWREMEQLSE